MSTVLDWLGEVGHVLTASGPYLLVGLFLAGLVKVLVPRRWIRSQLGDEDWRSVGKAALVGAPVPLCSCSVIPTAAALREQGASRGATASFLIATPETGVDSIGISWALLDPFLTVARPVAAVATAVAGGLSVSHLAGDAPAEPAPAPDAACCHASDAAPAADPENPEEDAPPPTGNVLRRAATYGYGSLLADLTPWLLIGFALSAALMLIVPEDFFGGRFPNGWPAMLVMLVAGVPLYVCATASTPVAAALMAKGLDPGAALVLLLAGPATNTATIGVVGKLLGRRAVGAYLGAIAVLSLAFGALANALYPVLGLDPGAVAVAGHEHVSAVSQVAGAVLALLLAVHAVQRLRR